MRVDYVVVGGGITGVCTALHLARRGGDVLLIERDQLAPPAPLSSSGEHAKAFRCAYGRDRRMTRLCRESIQYWRQLEQEAGCELLVPSGMIVFGADQPSTLRHWTNADAAGFAADSRETLQAEGLPHEFLSRRELVSRYPQIAENDFYDHAILDRTAGFVHARTAVREVGRLAADAGTTIWEHTTVLDCVRDGDRVERLITTRGDVVPVVAVVFAAGHMNGTLAPELRPKTKVTRQQVLYLAPENPAPFDPSRFPIVVNVNQWRYVFPVHGPGITKVADDDTFPKEKEIDPRQQDRAGADDWFRAEARDFLRAFVPGLAAAAEVDSLTCRYTNTVNGNYLIYKRANTVVLSACSGHGFKNAPMTSLIAAGLADSRTEVHHLSTEFGYEHAASF